MHKALHPSADMDKLFAPKKKEEESPAVKNTSMHRYDNSNTT